MRINETIQNLWDELSVLNLVGPAQWEHGLRIAKGILDIKKELSEEEKMRNEAYKEAYNASIEQKRKQREQAKKEAAERGEEIIGGETVRINADGTQEVLIP